MYRLSSNFYKNNVRHLRWFLYMLYVLSICGGISLNIFWSHFSIIVIVKHWFLDICCVGTVCVKWTLKVLLDVWVTKIFYNPNSSMLILLTETILIVDNTFPNNYTVKPIDWKIMFMKNIEYSCGPTFKFSKYIVKNLLPCFLHVL